MKNDYSVARISLDNLTHNYNIIKGRTSGGAMICPVIKANAYGHGACRLAHLYKELGASYLAVARMYEAAEIRNSGINLPILILGHTSPSLAGELAALSVTQTVGAPEYAEALNSALSSIGATADVHIKLETGMLRLGFSAADIDTLSPAKLDALNIRGAFTHFAVADTPSAEDYTRKQAERFIQYTEKLTHLGYNLEIKHAANSAAIISYPEYHFDMVRPGIILYGMPPSQELSQALPLRAAMTLESKITRIYELEVGESVGYGRVFIADKRTKIATVAIGYADGIPRNSAAAGVAFTVRGKSAKVVGRVCMDQLMLDVTDIEGVRVGDIVTIFGGEGNASAHRLASTLGTISYELLTAVASRIERIYE